MPYKPRIKRAEVYNSEDELVGYACVNDTRRRWRALGLWVIVFTLITFFTLGQSLALSRDNKRAIKAGAPALIELCRTNAILRGLAAEDVDLYKSFIESPGVNKGSPLFRRLSSSVDIRVGFIAQLDQQTACRDITNP